MREAGQPGALTFEHDKLRQGKIQDVITVVGGHSAVAASFLPLIATAVCQVPSEARHKGLGATPPR